VDSSNDGDVDLAPELVDVLDLNRARASTSVSRNAIIRALYALLCDEARSGSAPVRFLELKFRQCSEKLFSEMPAQRVISYGSAAATGAS
jgi:hypothetical protein